jgi:phenylalanyl-tRNA synthetase beta chain
VFVAELDLDRAAARATPPAELVRPLPRYPTVVRDLSIVVANTLPAEIIRGTIHAAAAQAGAARAPLVAMSVFDRYQGKGVPEGRVSLSLRLTFRAPDRTLTDQEAQDATARIVTALRTAHGAEQR